MKRQSFSVPFAARRHGVHWKLFLLLAVAALAVSEKNIKKGKPGNLGFAFPQGLLLRFGKYLFYIQPRLCKFLNYYSPCRTLRISKSIMEFKSERLMQEKIR